MRGVLTVVFHGGWRYLEAAIEDVARAAWSNGANMLIGGTSKELGAGKANTAKIIAKQGVGTYAAANCVAYTGGGLHDWYLPSRDELDLMYQNLVKNRIGHISYQDCWSSSESDEDNAWTEGFYRGGNTDFFKETVFYVRPVRQF